MGEQSYRRNRSTQKARQQMINGNTIHPGVHHTGLYQKKVTNKADHHTGHQLDFPSALHTYLPTYTGHRNFGYKTPDPAGH